MHKDDMPTNDNGSDDPQPQDEAPNSLPAPVFRCRVTALLDCGGAVDSGVYTAHSVPQLIHQARQRLSAQQLLQVVRWRLDVASGTGSG
jgi:hypothetical protein